MALRFKIKGISQFFSKAKRAAERAMKESIKQTGQEILRRVQAKAPVRTGRARASWRFRIENDGLKYVIYSDLVYINKLEYGGYRGPGPRTRKPVQTAAAPMVPFVSKQAPSGMLRITLAEGDKLILLRNMTRNFKREFRNL